MKTQDIKFGEGLTLLSVSVANALAQEFKKEDLFIIAAFLSSIAANIYVITNASISHIIGRVEGGEAEAEP